MVDRLTDSHPQSQIWKVMKVFWAVLQGPKQNIWIKKSTNQTKLNQPLKSFCLLLCCVLQIMWQFNCYINYNMLKLHQSNMEKRLFWVFKEETATATTKAVIKHLPMYVPQKEFPPPLSSSGGDVFLNIPTTQNYWKCELCSIKIHLGCNMYVSWANFLLFTSLIFAWDSFRKGVLNS